MLTLLTSVNDAYGIGKDGTIPWKHQSDLKFFKDTTINNIVVMGRKSYDKIGKLKDRLNFILSENNSGYCPKEDVTYCNNSDDIIGMSLFYNVYIIGGETIYRLFLTKYIQNIDSILIVKVPDKVETDSFFPKDLLDESFKLSKTQQLEGCIYVERYQKSKTYQERCYTTNKMQDKIISSYNGRGNKGNFSSIREWWSQLVFSWG